MYTADFMTPQGMDREAWAQIRSEHIMSKQKIHHNIRNLRIEQEGLDAVVKFTQIYADERIQIIDRKTMRWVYRDGRWLITQEATD